MKLKFSPLLLAIILALPACDKHYVEPKPAGPVGPTGPTGPTGTTATVFFSTDIKPFLNTECTGCHSGSLDPNLTEANSYSDLTTKTSSSNCSSVPYVNTSSPANSLIYTKLLPTKPCGDQMGTNGYGTVTQSQIDNLLKWIQEGAKNN